MGGDVIAIIIVTVLALIIKLDGNLFTPFYILNADPLGRHL